MTHTLRPMPSIPALDQARPAVIGLGYVGLPLALAFGRLRESIGFDIHQQRIDALPGGEARVGEAQHPERELRAVGEDALVFDGRQGDRHLGLAQLRRRADPEAGYEPLLDDPPLDEPLLDEPEDDPPSEEVDEAADAATDELLEPLPVLLDRESVR